METTNTLTIKARIHVYPNKGGGRLYLTKPLLENLGITKSKTVTVETLNNCILIRNGRGGVGG